MFIVSVCLLHLYVYCICVSIVSVCLLYIIVYCVCTLIHILSIALIYVHSTTLYVTLMDHTLYQLFYSIQEQSNERQAYPGLLCSAGK